MYFEQLREKDASILNLIVELYLRTGKPVSSGTIAQKSKKYSVSSATVRNIMAGLEKEGFLFQPHTSSGRIPTDNGLRLYVKQVIENVVFADQVNQFFSEDMTSQSGDFNSLLMNISKILSEYTDNIGFVISPKLSHINFRNIRLIKISENRVMVILVTTQNLVLTEIVETSYYFTQRELDRATHYINFNFSGKNLYFVRDFILKELPRYRSDYEDIINRLTVFLKEYLKQEETESKVFLEGTAKLFEKVEFLDPRLMHSMFEKFEQKAKLAKLLSDFISLDRVKVLIGSELNLPDLPNCSLVLSHYGYENKTLGSLGIIGPRRIPYKKIIPLVDSVAKRLSSTISNKQ
ncbi:MAG: heat-inducible transcription repressor HrcA [Candidatus Aminicenantes bacterium]|nr:heat-inducible transcription repressor HrcA [Candidatus Aminicenantes bacterium]